MTLGHNFDFESYCIVGHLVGNGQNVYANTARYNYGPIFMLFQGFLYKLSVFNSENWLNTYRFLLVSLLTIVDLGITWIIACRYSARKALLFFLNPISIIITGYHNQFDNMAILFALLSMFYFNKDKSFNKKDLCYLMFISLSLITKHIFFLLPIFILFMQELPIKKKLVYSIMPPVLFVMSFIPAMFSNGAIKGIINNVFLYRSSNNSPLLQFLYTTFYIPQNLKFVVYIVIMLTVAYMVRKLKYNNILMVYMIAMVTFSSAIANQYLIIPLAALFILDASYMTIIYVLWGGLFLCLETNGLGLISQIKSSMPDSIVMCIASYCVKYGYNIAVLILLFALIFIVTRRVNNN